MPIIYMHGVNTRDPKHFNPVHEYLQRIVAPAIAKDPENVLIRPADWYLLCDPPKWGGISRPRTMLTGQGAEEVMRSEILDAILKKAQHISAAGAGDLISGHRASPLDTIRIDTLSDDDLADLMTISAARPGSDETRRAKIGIAADRVARDPSVRTKLTAAKDLEEQLPIVTDALDRRLLDDAELIGAGFAEFLSAMKDRLSESISRTVSAPAAAVTVVADELRPALNDFVTRFLGDVLFYVTRRGTPAQPGKIPLVLLNELDIAQKNKEERGGEPILLLTHSMGGQIAYDTVTSFLPASGRRTKVDFWCATASQVGFFEEMNMFLASSTDFSEATGKRTPIVTSNLGHWWNVWDPNDIISFTTKGIFDDGIDDEKFWGGMSLIAAHGSYLARPSFYREFADKLKTAFPGRAK